jgi:hypothetical protein
MLSSLQLSVQLYLDNTRRRPSEVLGLGGSARRIGPARPRLTRVLVPF